MKSKIVASIILVMMLMQVTGSTLITSIAVVKENVENASQYVTEDDLVYSEKYLVKDNIISKIDPNTTKEEFIKNLEIAKNEKVEIYKKDSETKVEAKELIGTGMTLKGNNGQEYVLSVRGDVTGDGKADQIELTMMIRHLIELKGWELKDINKLSADITGDDKIDLVDIDKIIKHIVFKKWEYESIEAPNPPTIKIVGEKVEGTEEGIQGKDIYKNKVEITIKAENKEKSSKTTYKITGQIEKEETSIEENEKIVLTEEGEYIVTAYTYGLQGNRSKASNVKIIIKKEEQNTPIDPDPIKPEIYNIEYVLNGGENSKENPNTYEEGKETALKNPTRLGYTFVGWYTEESFTNKIERIEKSQTGDITLYAKWTPNTDTKYKVIYEQMGTDGKTYEVVETENKEGTTDSNVTPELKDYEGFTKPEPQEVIIEPDGSTIVIYRYERNKYEFTLGEAQGIDTQGSTISKEYYYEEEIRLNAKTEEGYTWKKWISSNEELIPSISEANATFKMPAGSLIMTPKATINTYTIKYELNGGINSEENPDRYTYGQEVVLKEPTKVGYTFEGWYTEEDFTNKIEKIESTKKENITLYANWTANTTTPYKIEHYKEKLNGSYKLEEIEECIGITDSLVTIVPNKYEGFIQTTNPNEVLSGTIKRDGSLVLKVYYSRNLYDYTIKYYYNNVEDETSRITEKAKYELNIEEYDPKNKDGYTFSKVEGIPLTIGTEENEIKVYHTINDYTINYNLNGGSVGTANPTTYNVETNTITLNNPDKVGYTFVGWTGSNGNVPELNVSIPIGSIGNKEYTANWTANQDTRYKVVHEQMNLDGETYTSIETEELEGTSDSKVTPEVKEYVGFTSPEAQEITIEADGSTILTYKYTRNKYEFTLGTAEGVNTQGSSISDNYYYGETINLNAVTNKGYTWEKWTSSNEELIQSTSETNVTFTMPSGNLSMTPTCTINTYTISYNLNNGSVGTANPTTYNVQTNTITLNNPAREGYTFIGWTGSNGDVPELNVSIPKGSIGNKEYIANWEDKTAPTITADLNVINKTTSSITVSIGAQDQGSGLSKIEWYHRLSIDSDWIEIDMGYTNNVEYYTKGTTNIENKTYTFEGLTQNDYYDIMVIIYDVARNKTTKYIRNEKTNELTIRLTADPAKEYTKGDVYVTIEANGTNTYYGTEVDAMNTPYTEPIQVTENGTQIHAYTTDGTNRVYRTHTISNIDKEAPNEFTISENSKTTNSVTINAGTTDNLSGISHYRYYYDGNIYVEAGANATIEGLIVGKTYTIYVVAYDLVGNTRQSSNTINVSLLEKAKSSELWEVDKTTGTLMSYLGTSFDDITKGDTIEIPDYVVDVNTGERTDIKIVGNGSAPLFYRNTLYKNIPNKKLKLPDTAEKISTNAFIETNGFIGDLVIPNSVKIIGSHAFNQHSYPKNSTSFTGNLILGNSVTTIETQAFYYCEGFRGNLIIPDSVTTIGGNAFSNCTGFTGNLIIPDSVTTLDAAAFSNCTGLNGTLTLLARIKYYSNSIFSGTNFTTLEIGSGVYADDNLTNNLNRGKITKVVFKDGVEKIGRAVCNAGFDNLVEVQMANTITEIEDDAFDGCRSLSSINFSTSLKKIGYEAFRECSGLKGQLVIPSVETIDMYAFYYCTGITGLTLSNNLQKMERGAFVGCTSLTGSLYIPDSIEYIEDSAFNATNLTSVSLPSKLISIQKYEQNNSQVFPTSCTRIWR